MAKAVFLNTCGLPGRNSSARPSFSTTCGSRIVRFLNCEVFYSGGPVEARSYHSENVRWF